MKRPPEWKRCQMRLYQESLLYPRFWWHQLRSLSPHQPSFSPTRWKSALSPRDVIRCKKRFWFLLCLQWIPDLHCPHQWSSTQTRSKIAKGVLFTGISLPVTSQKPFRCSIYDTMWREVCWPHMVNGVYTTVAYCCVLAHNRAEKAKIRHLKLFSAISPQEFIALGNSAYGKNRQEATNS